MPTNIIETDKVFGLTEEYVLGTYQRTPICFVKGKGVKIWDSSGKEYLDFFPGWAVSGLGHCPDILLERVASQMTQLIHVSNNFYNELQGKLAEKIIKNSFPGKVFFCNSGTEAVEAAIKLARIKGKENQFEIITMESSFHGRTTGSMAATGQDKIKKGFEPILNGFKHVSFNRIQDFKAAVSKNTVAVILEPIQGEGGIHVADKEYLKEVRKICDENDILLIFDEVQTGMGRCGEYFSFKCFGVTPDAMMLAKSLGNGFPIGALVVSNKVAHLLGPGTHASTFGGNPIACAAGLAVFEMIETDNLLDNVNRKHKYIMSKLNALKGQHPSIVDIRGFGLMLGIELSEDMASSIVDIARSRGLLLNATQGNIIRFMPPMIVCEEDIDRAILILAESLREAGK